MFVIYKFLKDEKDNTQLKNYLSFKIKSIFILNI